MIAYLDSSTILRIVLGQDNALKEWRSITEGAASALVEVECLCTLDQLRLAEGLDDAEIAVRREAVFQVLEAVEVVELTRPVLARAAQPLPTALGTLDAIHLATALLWKDRSGEDLVMATHDDALATAARASGLRVVGAARGFKIGSTQVASPSTAPYNAHDSSIHSLTCWRNRRDNERANVSDH